MNQFAVADHHAAVQSKEAEGRAWCNDSHSGLRASPGVSKWPNGRSISRACQSKNGTSGTRLIPEQIPKEITAVPQWVAWRYELRSGKGGGKLSKVPICIRTGRYAAVNDPNTWSLFESALAAYRDRRLDVSGIGFVFSGRDGFAGIDLDDCLGKCNLKLTAFATSALKHLPTYTEVSPSGRGLKCVVRCRQQFPGVKNSLKGFEPTASIASSP